MSEYTVDLYFVGADVDDALQSLPFLEQDHAEQYRADSDVTEFLRIYEAEVHFTLATSDLQEVDV